MLAWFQRNPLIVVLSLLAVALAAVVAFELGFGNAGPTGEATRRVVAAEPRLLPPVSIAVAEQEYPETANRPLFTPTRRPAPTAAAAAAPTFARGQFVLLGVTVAGETRIAMLREKSSGRIHRVEQGRDVNGIKITQIEPEVVTLAQGDEREVLSMQVQKAGAVPGAPAPAGGPMASGPFAGQSPPNQITPGSSNLPISGMAPNIQATPPQVQPGMPTPPVASAQPPANAQFFPPAGGAATPNATGQPTAGAPMTPEELLARRRARRSQQTQ